MTGALTPRRTSDLVKPRDAEVTIKRKDRPKPPTGTLALNLWLYLVGFGVFGALGTWAAIATIQGAVVAGGTFEVAGDLRVVDHLEGGIVRDIHVQDGAKVKAGDVIAQLDDTRYRAQYKILRSQLAGALARHARLDAEMAKAEGIAVPAELRKLIDEESEFAEILDAQIALFESNRATDDGEIAIYSERIRQMEERLRGIEDRMKVYRTQLALVQKDARTLEELLDKGLARRDRVIERQEDEIVLFGRISDAGSEHQDLLKQISEVREMQLHVERQRQRSIANELQTVSEQIVDLRQRLRATEDVISRLDIRAPISGQIIGFEVNTAGAVIEPGQRILQIVPEDSSFVIEAQVSTGDIDEIRVGSPARVRLSSYSYRKVAPVVGAVTYVSADAFYNEGLQESYYQIHVEVPNEAIEALPDVHPVPGMPVQVMIATKEQTVLNHLLDPVLGGLETAFVEGE